MNPLLNPKLSFSLLKNYLVDPGRLNRLDNQRLKKYIDKAFKQTVKYAYSVPVYNTLYKKAGIHPNDINRIDDITKLPFISKKNFVESYPDGLVPPSVNRNKAFVISTGGTTGKPVSIFTDFYTMSKGTGPTLREMNIFNINWRKSKIVHIGNFSPYRFDLIAQKNFYNYIQTIFRQNNILNMDVNTPMIDIMRKLDSFSPDIIMTYPAIFQYIAYFKRKGHGQHIHPKILLTGGSILDDYTKAYVEDAFNCQMLNIYPSVEAGGIIAFECNEGTWHINSDFFYVEAIDSNNTLVAPGERGHIVLTRLWGKGTPIIRYTGMDDWIKLSYEECGCGLRTPTLKGGVEGRMRANIVLPNGKVFPSGAFCFICPVLHELHTYKIKQYQIIQHALNEIEILLVIDEDLRDIGPSVAEISKRIKDIYQEKTGPTVTIHVNEVKEIPAAKNSGKPPPIVVSHVTTEQGYTLF
jgi:phenylacetate-CoA ligase